MSASSSISSITCGCLHFPVFTKARRIDGIAKQDAQRREAGDGVDPSTPIISTLPSQVPPIISESPSMNRGKQSGAEAGGGIDPDQPDPPISTEASNVTTETTFMSLFQAASNFQISNASIAAIGGNATIYYQYGCDQFTETQRNLICDHIATFATLPDINDKLKKHILIQLIILLPRAEAVFNDYQNNKKSGPCFEGTRVALLREMANWVPGQDDARMYILSGLAGIGKSTVAYTIASRAADLHLLGASFFFSRDEADRNNAKKLFTTIAYQLCVYNEDFSEAIGDVLLTERGSAAVTKDPKEQLQVLILDPLRNIVKSRARQILVVIDALDECCEDDLRAVVVGLSQLVQELPSFKVILTTRPLPYLDYLLGKEGSRKLFHLQDIEDKVVDGDIRLYLRYNLSLEKIRERFPRRQWCASDEQIDALVRAAGRLFIIASTAVRYILDRSASNPAAQTQELLRAYAQDHTPFKDLDHFYTIILQNVVPANFDNQNIVSRYQSVVGAIISVSRPLPVPTLAHLIDIDVEEIHAVLDNLQSVILLGDNNVPRIYHKSFPDYLTDQARCKDSCLRIDPKIAHTQIATGCFEITNKHLKYNILGLGNVARYMSNEDGLKKDRITDEQLQEKIPQQLRYACVYWVDHFEVAKIEDTNLMNGLEKFVDEHTLHWFEVLSLIENLDFAHRAIRVAIKLLKSTSLDLHQLLSDALRFISMFYELIKQSALHTYHSALPFTPTDSLLYRRYIKEVRHNICDIDGGPEKWNTLVANLNHGEGVAVIKFSSNSVLFVSCSEEHVKTGRIGRLKIWDAATGTPVSTIPGRRFAFTDGFSTIASFKDNIITCYNKDGSTRGTIITTSSTIVELALSESSRVAAALSDGTVWLWESKNAELISSFDGFDSTDRPELFYQFTPQFQFSPTGTRLAYSSTESIVLRDGISGRFIADLRCGPKHRFIFSDDGSLIASLARDYGLALWDTESGRPINAVRVVGHYLLAISANGSLLATAQHLGTNVVLWSDHLATIKILEAMYVMSIALSPNNILAIVSAVGIQLYDTNTHSFIFTQSFSQPPGALAFSPDGAYLACGNSSGNMHLWDIRGIDTSSPLSQDATGIHAMALSRDCSRLACGFLDGIVELWGTSPIRRRIASDQARLTVVFTPDGRLLASMLHDEAIQLWNAEDGSLHGTLDVPSDPDELRAVALSNSVLVAVGSCDITMWRLDTLSHIHTLKGFGGRVDAASISDDGDLAALGFEDGVRVIDVKNHAIIAEFTVSNTITMIDKLSFLPDKSQLVVQTVSGDFLSFDLINKRITNGPTLEHLIQLPETPLWHGVPVWLCWPRNDDASGQHYVAALFSQHQTPVPVLWIPKDTRLDNWSHGSSMIALGCRDGRRDGRIILLRLHGSHDE